MSEERVEYRAPGERRVELLPCPFCGEMPGLVEADHIECDWPGCPVHVYVDDIHEDPRTVAERWNTRVNKGGAK